MMLKSILLIVALQLTAFASMSQAVADGIVGVWLTAGKEPAKIQIYRSSGQYEGKIIWLKYPTDNSKPKVDINNPDKTRRNQPIFGLIILKHFKFAGDDEWEDGNIYDPESGKTYRCYLTLKDKKTLKVRGYIGISLFGRTEIWTRQN
jgi:uncharacterized protein (DUF2147 family)